MNISVLIPTRGRPEGLRRAIESILATADRPSLIEFVFRIDEDDHTNLDFIFWSEDLRRNMNVTRILGKRDSGNGLYWECAGAAEGQWLMFFNDDMEICQYDHWTTRGWDTRLMEIPQDKFVVTPERNISNGHLITWEREGFQWHTAHAFFAPNGWWKEYGLTSFGGGDVGLSDYGKKMFTERGVPQALDTFTLNYLAGRGFGGDGKGMGWNIAIIKNLTTMHHQVKDKTAIEAGNADHGLIKP